jgi:hypothetical protein
MIPERFPAIAAAATLDEAVFHGSVLTSVQGEVSQSGVI